METLRHAKAFVLVAGACLAGCATRPIQIGPPDLDTSSPAAPRCRGLIYPGSALLGSDRGTVVVKVRVAPDGRIESAAIDTPSMVTSLDEASVNAARRSCRFEPLPAGEPQQPRTVKITFVWDLIAAPGRVDQGVTRVGIQPSLQ